MDLAASHPEAVGDLRRYADLIAKWSKRINLVAPATIPDIWTRHLLDSAQLFPLLPAGARELVDLGSGGGLPVAVLAILAKAHGREIHFHALEADTRKCAFLRTVKRELQLDLTVHEGRIEVTDLQPVDVVTARALAPLSTLLSYAEKLRLVSGTCLFLKGESVETEISSALEIWQFDAIRHQSVTSRKSAVVEIGEFARV